MINVLKMSGIWLKKGDFLCVILCKALLQIVFLLIFDLFCTFFIVEEKKLFLITQAQDLIKSENHILV